MIKYSQIAKTILFISVVSVAAYYLTRGPTYPSLFEVTDISNKIQSNQKQDFSGSMLVNLDEDPELEIFIACHGTSNLFFKKSKDQFHPISIPELADADGLTFSVNACDLDQDGRDEILILNRQNTQDASAHSRVVKYVNGKWVDLLLANDPVTESLKLGYSSTCVDRKGDGKYGLAISKENGKLSYLELVNSKITDIADDIGLGLVSKGRSILGVPGPEGRTNIFEGNEDGSNFYFENKGDGTFTEKAEAVGLSDHLFNARGISIIDINNDDIVDIIYGNNLGPTRLLEQSREGKFTDVTPEIMKDAYAVNSPLVGDFNLDGYEDIYLNNIRGYNKMFVQFNKDWHELDIGVLAEKNMFGISSMAADLDQNGSYDILNTHGDGSQFPLTLYSIKPVNQWIKFSARYESRGIPRGAVILLRTNLRNQVRAISSGSGRFANYDETVMFGMLKNEVPKSAEIILPSSMRIEYKGDLNLMNTHEFIIPALKISSH